LIPIDFLSTEAAMINGREYDIAPPGISFQPSRSEETISPASNTAKEFSTARGVERAGDNPFTPSKTHHDPSSGSVMLLILDHLVPEQSTWFEKKTNERGTPSTGVKTNLRLCVPGMQRKEFIYSANTKLYPQCTAFRLQDQT